MAGLVDPAEYERFAATASQPASGAFARIATAERRLMEDPLAARTLPRLCEEMERVGAGSRQALDVLLLWMHENLGTNEREEQAARAAVESILRGARGDRTGLHGSPTMTEFMQAAGAFDVRLDSLLRVTEPSLGDQIDESLRRRVLGLVLQHRNFRFDSRGHVRFVPQAMSIPTRDRSLPADVIRDGDGREGPNERSVE